MERAETAGFRPPVSDSPAPPVLLTGGGAGDYIVESGEPVPKPMLSIGGRPLLVHIMRRFADYGSTEFLLALTGTAERQVKHYLSHVELRSATFTIRLGSDPIVRVLDELPEEGWTITCTDTGESPGTGTRLRNAAVFVPRWPVIVAYGNGVADVNVADLVRFHRSHGRLATVVVAAPPARSGRVKLTDDHRVLGFGGPPHTQPGVVSTGVFVLEEAAIADYIQPHAEVMFDAEPIRELIADGELMAYRHHGSWQPLDTWEDLAALRRSWSSGVRIHPGEDGRLSALTNRELQVATLIGNCLTNRAIARRLSVAEKTVEMHLSNIFSKLAVSSRTELAALMIRTQRA